MKNTRILTTVIGSYPKPADLLGNADGRTLLDSGGRAFHDQKRQLGDAGFSARVDRAVEDAIRDQIEAGIDIVTDGEMRRGHYIHDVVAHLDGVNTSILREQDVKKLIGGARRVAYTMKKPVVSSRIAYAGPFLVEGFEFAQRLASVPVKVTLPGPATVADGLVNEHYPTVRALAHDYAESIRKEIVALRDAGCSIIQFDDPGLLRDPSRAEVWGIEMLERCLDGVDGLTTIVHVCRSYPNKKLDELGIQYKSDQDHYPRLLQLLAESTIDQVAIEAKRDALNPAVLPHAGSKTVVLGCVDVGSNEIESEEEIIAQAQAALAHLAPGQLVLAPDCGMIQLRRAAARGKLAGLALAARALNGTATTRTSGTRAT